MERQDEIEARARPALPEALQVRLRTADRNDADAIELIAVDADGVPHLAHLSIGEVLLGADGDVCVGLWSGSATAAAVERTRRAALYFTSANTLIEARCEVIAVAALAARKQQTGFHLRISHLRDKRAPYARILSGVRFAYNDPERAARDWAELRSALLAAFPNTITGDAA